MSLMSQECINGYCEACTRGLSCRCVHHDVPTHRLDALRAEIANDHATQPREIQDQPMTEPQRRPILESLAAGLVFGLAAGTLIVLARMVGL